LVPRSCALAFQNIIALQPPKATPIAAALVAPMEFVPETAARQPVRLVLGLTVLLMALVGHSGASCDPCLGIR
jgi:hypothetical protein